MTAIRPIDATRWALAQPIEDAAQKLLLIAIANHYDRKSGLCDVTNDALIALTRFSLATLKRRRLRLEQAGWISVQPGFSDTGKQQANRYSINFGQGIAKPPKGAHPGARLPVDWTLPEAWRKATLEAHPVSPQAVDTAAACFKQFWTELPDTSAALRKDWRAVWRHWCARQFSAPKRAQKQQDKERDRPAWRRASEMLGRLTGVAA